MVLLVRNESNDCVWLAFETINIHSSNIDSKHKFHLIFVLGIKRNVPPWAAEMNFITFFAYVIQTYPIKVCGDYSL